MGQVGLLILLVISVQFYLDEAAPNWRARNKFVAVPRYEERDYQVGYSEDEDEDLLMYNQNRELLDDSSYERLNMMSDPRATHGGSHGGAQGGGNGGGQGGSKGAGNKGGQGRR